jgi:hypothetical protein
MHAFLSILQSRGLLDSEDLDAINEEVKETKREKLNEGVDSTSSHGNSRIHGF